ncbi:MAG: hypothetical protein ACRDKW_06925 [Actinomycetota bacterium]
MLAFVLVVAVGGFVTLVFFAVQALASARALQRAVAGARQQLEPQVEELAATAKHVAERVQRLRP